MSLPSPYIHTDGTVCFDTETVSLIEICESCASFGSIETVVLSIGQSRESYSEIPTLREELSYVGVTPYVIVGGKTWLESLG